MIAVVKNTGGTNLSSVCHALDRIGASYTVTADPKVIASSDKVLLPGVGAARPAMQRLKGDNLDSVLCNLSQPVLGICLGMQLLFESSEEGNTPCLAIIPGKVQGLKATDAAIRIPHMGWNKLVDFDPDYPLCRNLPTEPYVYFVHSYLAPTGPWVKATTDYGQKIPSIIQHRNFFGCQFHPEKSSHTGATILRNFIEMSHVP